MNAAEVPAELVEAAARALRDEQCTGRDHGTDACPDRHCRDDSVLPWYRDRVREPLAAVLPEVQAQALRDAAVRLRTIADEMETSDSLSIAVHIAVENTRHDATILDDHAARLTATTERTTT